MRNISRQGIACRAEALPARKESLMRRGLLLGALAIILMLLTVLVTRMADPTHRIGLLAFWTQPLVIFGLCWALLELGLLAYKTVLWHGYRPNPPATGQSAPSLTVIIPAYNEGAMITNSLLSVINANYPRDRLQIIAIDDGSTDDTWRYISAVWDQYRDAITVLRFEQNRGKRAALREAFKRASGEIAVTVDSDSIIEADTLLALVSPFADPQVGAVAGKVLVHNRDAGLIPRMLQVAYILSFDFVRTAQSRYRNVYCCPGALAAYRISAVRAVLKPWFEQRFLGAPCTYGEDRALSNYILGLGMDIVYQGNAVVHTLVPVRYGGLCKMFLRWYRSFVREEIRLIGHIIWQRPVKPRIAALVDKTITDVRYCLRYVVTAIAIWSAVVHPGIIPWLIMGTVLVSILPVLYYLRSDPSWRCLYAGVYAYCAMLALWWILPYAACTLRSQSWMTR